ncbi:myosin XVB [Hyla sarda]|uniref:myosin XVB n=1 Tax=Hyla sarda TaxID=327740 RepID=UPI0024C40B4A|nr:myosin XVB [Hyla sarda]
MSFLPFVSQVVLLTCLRNLSNSRTSYDRVLSPLSVEASIDVRDAISQTLYALLFDWLLEKGNDWLFARETDSSLDIIDICGFENLGVNSLEQLCRNFANEQIQRHSIESLISQEQVHLPGNLWGNESIYNILLMHFCYFYETSKAEYAREGLCWVPFSTEGSESCLGLLTDRPHGILQILEEQSKLAQATDHTFLQKCHYHHGDNSCYIKPKLPLPVFTLHHYCGPVTYQVHNFLSKNRDRLPDVAREVLAQSRLKLLSDIVKRDSSVPQPQEGKSLNKCPYSTLTGRFQLTLQELTFRLKRSHTFFVRCISPNPKKLPGIFDVEFVSSQLRNSGILEAVQLIKDGYPIRIPLGQFVNRYGHLAGRECTFTEDRKYCAAVLTKIFGESSALYQIGNSKVFLKERSREILQRKWEEIQSLAALTLQKNLRGFLNRKNFQEYRRKITVVQAQVRGRQARQRYRRLKNTRVQFGAVLLISRIPSIHRRICQLKATGEESPPSMDLSALDVPAELAAVLNSAQAKSHAQGTSITEVPPPQVKAQCVLSLPPDINNYPFSIFIRSYFRDPTLPPLGQPLQNPLTRVPQNDNGVALELYKLALRFVGNTTMPTWQQRIIGNYIVERCLRQPSLTDEVLCQAATFTVQNNNEEQIKRVGLLLSSLLSCLIPSPTLEKPLLKYVSDQGSEGYKAICQSKLLRAKQNEFNTLRTHALTLLEWTANERKGSMVVDVYTYSEEKYTAEVDSWTTAEQLAGWLLQSRGVGDIPHGWSISILDENQWLDLCGDDLLLDVIAEIEDGAPSQPFSDYPFGDNDGIPEPPPDFAPQLPPGHPSFSALELPPSSPPGLPPAPPPPPVPPPFEGFGDDITIPPAPPMQAPSLPPSRQDSGLDQMYSTNINGGSQRMENYVDQLFNPVFTSTDLERSENLNRRMKGGGGIGPTRQNSFGSPAYTGMGSMPSYGMPMMNGMMPAMGNMPMMPNIPAMMPQMMPQTLMPQMMPQAVPMPQPMVHSVDPTQLAAQQQAFIQQQALLLAQQMTLQATMLSQQQQQNLPNTTRAHSPPPKLTPKPAPKPEAAPKLSATPVPLPSPKAVPDPPLAPSSKQAPTSSPPPQVPKPEPPKLQTPVEVYWDEEAESEYKCQRKTFKERREFFQQMVSEGTRVKSLKPPSKILLPIQTTEPENDSDEEPPEPPEPEPQPEIAMPKAPPIVPPPVRKTTETPEKETKKAGGIIKPAPRPEPSREIREIIKMFQSRPHEEPKPFEPVRRPIQTFIKKKDPKEEALERLRMAGPPPPPEAPKLFKSSQDLQDGPAPPPLPPPLPAAEKMADSIREKQKPLMGLFQSGSSPFAPTEKAPKSPGRTLEGDHTAKSSISKHTASVFFSYSDANWKIYVRKEIFYPKEKFTHPYYLNLLCQQILRDTYSETSFKITREERRKMRDFLNEFQVGSDANSILEDSFKKRIVIAARDNWENYFSRLFPVTLDDNVDQLIIGVSHRGFRLLKEVNATGIQKRHLKTLCSYSFADILSIEKPDSHSLHFNLRNEDLRVHSDHAQALKILLEIFLQELMKDSNHVVALRSHITDDKSLLQFKKGDIIKVLPMDGLEPGWQFGSLGGRSGLFPSRFVQPAAVPDYYSVVEKTDTLESRPKPRGLRRTISKESGQVSEESLPTYSPPPPILEATHYTMVEFALKYFRDAQTMLGWKGMAAEGKKSIELVQHTKVPIQESLIYYTDKELNEMATNNFMTLMRFMRDQQYREPDDVKCIYEILVLCREKPPLRDEIYCQILKQITENPKHESCNRGWTLLSLLTGYFIPTPTLLPCVTKYLQETSDIYQEISRSCQEHLRHTLLYHGRKHLPPRQELEALLNGRISRRLVIVLPGGIEYTTKIKTFTVAADLVLEICEQLLVTEPREVEEFAVFANKNKGEVVRPMRAGDYIHDFLLQDNSVTLEFRRVTWKATLKGRSELFVQVHYSQVYYDYMQGKALLLSPPDKLEMYTGKVAAILHRIKGISTPPDKQDLLGYIPLSVQNRLNLQTVQQNLLQELRTLQSLNVDQAKLRFLETVSALPLFDYNIYQVKRISEPHILTPCFVAVNHQQFLILQNNSTQPSITVNLHEVHSMRTMRPLDSNTLPGVELHYGTAADPHTLWIELQEAKELYHTMALIIETQETAAP